jgi:hypothetical protein
MLEYHNMLSRAAEVKAAWDCISDLTTEASALAKEKPEGYKDQIVSKQKEIEEKTLVITSMDADQFIKDRTELVFRILKDNGVKDPKFFKAEFWDEQVDVNDIMNFLTDAINKDTRDAKKNLILM